MTANGNKNDYKDDDCYATLTIAVPTQLYTVALISVYLKHIMAKRKGSSSLQYTNILIYKYTNIEKYKYTNIRKLN